MGNPTQNHPSHMSETKRPARMRFRAYSGASHAQPCPDPSSLSRVLPASAGRMLLRRPISGRSG